MGAAMTFDGSEWRRFSSNMSKYDELAATVIGSANPAERRISNTPVWPTQAA